MKVEITEDEYQKIMKDRRTEKEEKQKDKFYNSFITAFRDAGGDVNIEKINKMTMTEFIERCWRNNIFLYHKKEDNSVKPNCSKCVRFSSYKCMFKCENHSDYLPITKSKPEIKCENCDSYKCNKYECWTCYKHSNFTLKNEKTCNDCKFYFRTPIICSTIHFCSVGVPCTNYSKFEPK
jgi:hypothetical protein